jgi:two-component sensor histidine kinase
VYTLSVADDGPGLPADFGKHQGSSLGQGILQSLARQLHGNLMFDAGPGTGAKVIFHA